MENGPEDFEKLRKLLKIKQHEQPPPGYFNNFSGLIISRIERDGRGDEFLSEVPWLRRLFQMFERSPMVGGLFGSAVCALVILGIMMANQVDKVPAGAYRPPSFANDNNAGVGSTQGSLALVNPDSQTSSTEVMFGSGSNTMSSASLQPASFTTVAPH